MKRFLQLTFLLLTVLACMVSSSVADDPGLSALRSGSASKEPVGAIYHWKTNFAPDSTDIAFIEQHNIRRIYVRMFDVAESKDYVSGFVRIVPIATTTFEAEVPEGVEIVPTVFITIEALREMRYSTSYYAELIIDRIFAMVTYNNLGSISEVQFDCDWTSSTREIYDDLCSSAKAILHEKNVELSITVRLHQLEEPAPFVDRGVLMLYNTGAFKNVKTHNSILDIRDVKPYLKRMKYEIPLDFAYPTFGWGIKFEDNKFSKIVTNPEQEIVAEGEHIRMERPAVSEVLEVKRLVELCLGAPDTYNILYHLDQSQLKNYTDNEINQILSSY